MRLGRPVTSMTWQRVIRPSRPRMPLIVAHCSSRMPVGSFAGSLATGSFRADPDRRYRVALLLPIISTAPLARSGFTFLQSVVEQSASAAFRVEALTSPCSERKARMSAA